MQQQYYSEDDMNFKVEVYGSLPSTQDLVMLKAMQDEEEGLVVQALTQSAGRGRQGNVWVSDLGNLYMSILIRPNCDASKAGELSFVTSLAILNAIKQVVIPEALVKVKWPNDVLVNNKKVAGLLLESDIDFKGHVHYISIGIGINVLSCPNDAISIAEVKNDQPLAIHPFRDIVLSELKDLYLFWKRNGFSSLKSKWLENTIDLNNTINVRLPNKEVNGIFRGISSHGALILEKDGKKMEISSGEVFFNQRDE
jgi:BirA family biotin operon repressor/biotin-[acetyl-CoA-carboxylase] ligase